MYSYSHYITTCIMNYDMIISAMAMKKRRKITRPSYVDMVMVFQYNSIGDVWLKRTWQSSATCWLAFSRQPFDFVNALFNFFRNCAPLIIRLVYPNFKPENKRQFYLTPSQPTCI